MAGNLSTAGICDAISTYAQLLETHREVLNSLNVYPVPDGDTGTNMALTVRSVVDELAAVTSAEGADGAAPDRARVCSAVGKGAVMGACGNSGVIMGEWLRAWAAELNVGGDAEPGVSQDASPTLDDVGAEWLAGALAAGSKAADAAVLTPVEGTIISVARAAAEAAVACGEAQVASVLRAARAAGQVALERTPEQLPTLAAAGVVDAGAAGYLLFIDALLVTAGEAEPPAELDLPANVREVLATGVNAEPVPAEAAVATAHGRGAHGGESRADLGPRYEVMFLLDAPDESVPGFRDAWGAIGDSIVTVGGEGLWNCHIHTDDIGGSIEAGIAVGRPHRIAVTDLYEQVEHIESHAIAAMGVGTAEPPPSDADESAVAVTGTCAVVAVSPAAGTDDLFRASGAAGTVTGGQTMNPSTAQLLSAVEATGADQVVLLPNNSNVIAVARLVDAHATAAVEVVPSKSVLAGLAAMLAFDADQSAADNQAAMTEAASAVTVAQVARAVRDAPSSGTGISVNAGDWMGLSAEADDRIVAAGSDLGDVAQATVTHLLEGERELLTVLVGADVDDEIVGALSEWLSTEHPDVEVEVLQGGQPHYVLQFAVE